MLEGRDKRSLQKSLACVFLQGPSGYFKVKYEMYPSKCGRTCGCGGLGYMSRSCRAVTDLSPDPSLCSVAPGCCGFDTCRRPRGNVQSCWRSSLPSEPRRWPCGHEESGEDGAQQSAYLLNISDFQQKNNAAARRKHDFIFTHLFCIS